MGELKIDKVRFGIHKDGAGHSAIWNGVVRGADYYFGSRSLMGRGMKVSLHGSGVSHVKVTAAGKTITAVRWRRPETPAQGAVCVAKVSFPGSFLRLWREVPKRPKKPIFAFDPAPDGSSIDYLFFYSKEAPSTLEDKLIGSGLTPILYSELSNGEFVSLAAHSVPFDDESVLAVLKRGIPRERLEEPFADEDRIEGLSMILLNAVQDGEALHLVNLEGLTIAKAQEGDQGTI